MKSVKILLLLVLVLTLSLSLLACGGADPDPTPGPDDDTPVDVSGVTFEDLTVDYDGEEKSLAVEGLPSGATVSYEGNGKTDAGVYTVKATLKNAKGETLKTLEATLTINKLAFTGRIYFPDKDFDYDGEAHSILVLNLPKWLTATYEGNEQIDPGTYTVRATFHADEKNYIVPAPAEAKFVIHEVEPYSKGLSFLSFGGSYTVSAFSGDETEVLIPSIYKKLPVTAIDSDVFKNNTKITSVKIGDNVTTIGANAFRGCSALADVTIGAGVTHIASYAFADCAALKALVLPKSLTTVGAHLLDGTPLVSLTVPFVGGSAVSTKSYLGYFFGATSYIENETCVPASLKFVTVDGPQNAAIPAYAFANCKVLKAIVLADGVKEVGNAAFTNCSSLVAVYLPITLRSVPANAHPYDSPFFGCSSALKVLCGISQVQSQDFGTQWMRCSTTGNVSLEFDKSVGDMDQYLN